MNHYLKIKVIHRTQLQWIIWMMLIITFFLSTGINFFYLPSMIKYSLDLLWLFLLLIIIKSHKPNVSKEIVFLCAWIICFFVITIINYTLNYQSILYYLWGVRNNFRFYVFFIACVFFVRANGVEENLKLFDKVFWINAVVCFIQYFVLDIKQDNLGGIFGVDEGCNGSLNLFFVIIIVKSIVFCMNKKESIANCLLKCGITLVISAFAELKFFYIEFAIIIFIAMLISGFSFRKLVIFAGGILGLAVGISLLIQIFPYFKDFFTFQGIIDSATNTAGYTSSGDLNRFTGIPIINKKFLTDFSARMFGLGLGNCDYSSYEFLNSPFFLRYSKLHYTWMSTTWMYLENGFVGLFFYFGFFVIIAICMLNKIRQKNTEKSVVQMVFIISICCIMIAVYNSSLRTEAAYMIYYVLSVPFWNNGIIGRNNDYKEC